MLNINDLSVSYGKHEVLKGVTATGFKPGTITGLIGPNAAGKSTLIQTIAGIIKPSSGTADVLSHGEVLTGRRRREAIGYVAQDLLSSASLTAFESLLISGRRAQSKRDEDQLLHDAAAVLERLGIPQLAHRYVHQLSGGQRQLVAVAQMLVCQPDLLLLDEPTSALDLRHQVDLLTIIREEVTARGCCALVAIHDLNLAARYCDKLMVLNRGVAQALGTPLEVLTPETLEDIYGIRARILNDEGTPVVCPVES